MIASDNRFHGTNSLNFVYRNGKTLRSKYFLIKYAENNRQKTYRAAVVVSKKVNKSAPVRNRIRRRLYELIRTEMAPKLKNIDVVITVFDDQVAKASAPELKSAFVQLIKQLN